MDKRTVINIQWALIIALVALLVSPYLVSRTSGEAGSMNMSSGMMQKMYPLDSAGVSVPTVSFTITKDSLDGWNLHVSTTDFTFTPQNIGQAPVADEGHVHLYIDNKLTVVMGPWYHIDSSAMAAGKHEIMVSLNANDHSVFADKGAPIQATQTLYVY